MVGLLIVLFIVKWTCVLVVLFCLFTWIRRRLAKPEQPWKVTCQGIVNDPDHGQVVKYEVRPAWDYKED